MEESIRQIVILQRGWVVLGDVSYGPRSDILHIKNASIIRQWGTTKGIGQLAIQGPTDKTILDPAGTIIAPENSVIFRINVEKNPQGKFYI